MSSIVQVMGDEKTGKTSFLLSFPKPLEYIELDIGGLRRATRPAIKQQIETGDIRVTQFKLPVQAAKSGNKRVASPIIVGAKELWYEVYDKYEKAALDDSVATIAFDSWQIVWNLCTNCYLQELQENDISNGQTSQRVRQRLTEFEYREPNSRMDAFIQLARNAGKNLVLTTTLRTESQNMTIDGKVVSIPIGVKPQGWSRTRNWADVEVQTSNKDKQFFGEITLCGYVREAEGQKFPNPTWQDVKVFIEALRGDTI